MDGVLRSQGAVSGNGTWNSTWIHSLGSAFGCSGYPIGTSPGHYATSTIRVAEVIHIDGQVVDAGKFALVNNGILVPIDPSEVAKFNFGPNGFYLNWQNAVDMTATGLGKDFSGLNNNWQPRNMDLTHVQTDFPGKQQT